MFKRLKKLLLVSKVRMPLGRRGELVAQQEYQLRGYQILDSNVFNRRGKQFGEIDFIAIRKNTITFVEVKTRTSWRFGNPAEAVHILKQQRLIKIVQWFLWLRPEFAKYQPRIDVCIVLLSKVDSSKKSVIILPNAVTLDS